MNADARQLYDDGMELFRNNRWPEALATFRRLQEMSDSYPEVAGLIADIQLKIELERLSAPTDSRQPRRPRWAAYLAGLVAVGLLAVGGAAASGALAQPEPAPPPARTARAVSLPTAAPTSTPRPSPTMPPTITPQPTATPPPTEVPTVIAEPGVLLVQTAAGAELTRTTGNIAIILDASGSMLARVGEERKIDIARSALTTLVGQLADETDVALSAYGARRANGCEAIDQLAPLAPLEREGMVQLIASVEPVNNSPTPIGLALQQMAASLSGVADDTLVVLVSDGEETCDADPVAIAAAIHQASPQIRIAVIGFSIGSDASRTRLAAIAESGGGPYYDAGDAPQLISALRQAITLSYQVRDAQGATRYTGPVGSQVPLEAGSYTVTVGDDAALSIAVTIAPAQQTSVEIREENGALRGGVVAP